MNDRFFIQEVTVPAGCRTVEHSLAEFVRPYVDLVMSADAMMRLCDQVKAQQEDLLQNNKRLKPVRIEMDLTEDEDRCYHWPHFYIGQVYVSFRRIQGEII